MKTLFTPKTVLLTLISALVASSSFSQTFNSTFDFASVAANVGGTTDPTTPPTATGLTFSSFSAAGYAGNNPNAGGRFSFTTNALGSVNGNDNFTTFTGSLDSTRYFQVTLTPQAGYSVDLNTIGFTIQRSGTGIRSYAVRSSVDGFGANLSASISPANGNLGVGPGDEFRYLLDANANAQNGSLVTLGSTFDAITSAVTFRFYGWNAEAVTGTFSVDNVVFSGIVTPVPEPSTLALLTMGLGAAGLLVLRRR